MKTVLNHILSSRFARNVAVLVAGTAGAQAISMAFAPLITRIYGPEAFGVLGTFVSIVTIMTPLSSLSLPAAIVLSKEDREAIILSFISIGFSLLIAGIVTGILALASDEILGILYIQGIFKYLFFVPLAMVFSTLLFVMNQWIIRKGLFKINARVSFIQSALLNISQVVIGLIMPVATVLIAVATFGTGFQAFMLWTGCQKNIERGTSGKYFPIGICREMWTVVRKYKDFVYYRTPQAFLNAASQSMPVLMLASLYGATTAGFYSLGRLVLAAPTNLIGQSVASVFYPRINDAVNNGDNSYALMVRATFYLSLIGVVPFGAVFFFGPWIFAYIFGEQWYIAGSYAQWLALWSYFGFINRPAVSAIPVFSLQKIFLVYEVASIALRAIGLVVGFEIFGNALGSIVIFSIVSATSNAALIAITMYSVSNLCESKRND